MTTYRVTWEVDIEARDEIEAARKVRQMQRSSEADAVVFRVAEHGALDAPEEIDLAEVRRVLESEFRARLAHMPAGARLVFTSPTGRPIMGPSDTIPARCNALWFTVEKDGNIEPEPVASGTAVFWDGILTQRDEMGRDLYDDDMGASWALEECAVAQDTSEDDEDDEAAA